VNADSMTEMSGPFAASRINGIHEIVIFYFTKLKNWLIELLVFILIGAFDS